MDVFDLFSLGSGLQAGLGVRYLQCFTNHTSTKLLHKGTNLVLGPSEKFYRRNPSWTFRNVHWYHLGDPKKVQGGTENFDTITFKLHQI